MFHLSFLKPKKQPRGFTIVEMLVAIAIILLFSSMTLASYTRFSGHITLDILTHNVALTVRQAQAFALGGRRFNTVSPPYGIHIVRADKFFFTFYADVNSSNSYDDTAAEFFEKFTLPAGPSVSDLCVNNVNGGGTCGLLSLDILYKSPKPDAIICATTAGGTSCTGNSDAEIVMSNATGAATVVAWKVGQISLK